MHRLVGKLLQNLTVTDTKRYRYVEMLERQHGQMVTAIQELYRRHVDGQGWPGEPLKTEPNGHPLTHDVLNRLGALKDDDQSDSHHPHQHPHQPFEEDLVLAQQRMYANGAAQMQRQDSSNASSPTSECSQVHHHPYNIPNAFAAQEPYHANNNNNNNVVPHGQRPPPTPPHHHGYGAQPLPPPPSSTQLRATSLPGHPTQMHPQTHLQPPQRRQRQAHLQPQPHPHPHPQFIPQHQQQQMYLHRQQQQQQQQHHHHQQQQQRPPAQQPQAQQPPGQMFFPVPTPPVHRQPSFSDSEDLSECSTKLEDYDSLELMRGLEQNGLAMDHPHHQASDHLDFLQPDAAPSAATMATAPAPAPAATTVAPNSVAPFANDVLNSGLPQPPPEWHDSYFDSFIETERLTTMQ